MMKVLMPIATLLALSAAAKAETPMDALPGVEAPAPIIQPLAEPLDGQPQADADGFVHMGDWDVKISGTVTVDIGAGTLNTLPR